MSELTRRRSTDAQQECWHVYYGDVRVGRISERSGVPHDVDQWGWDCGFHPLSHRGRQAGGTAATFDEARACFEAAWKVYLTRCTEADFDEYRRQEAWTTWKYAMHDAGLKLPTQSADSRSRCLCGATIDIPGLRSHVNTAHMTDPQQA
jgi:hypothetical protein